jgi:hypothetical protein
MKKNLSKAEIHGMRNCSMCARALYLLVMRPLANDQGELHISDDDLAEKMLPLIDEAGRAKPEGIAKRIKELRDSGLISKQYADTARSLLLA